MLKSSQWKDITGKKQVLSWNFIVEKVFFQSTFTEESNTILCVWMAASWNNPLFDTSKKWEKKVYYVSVSQPHSNGLNLVSASLTVLSQLPFATLRLGKEKNPTILVSFRYQYLDLLRVQKSVMEPLNCFQSLLEFALLQCPVFVVYCYTCCNHIS